MKQLDGMARNPSSFGDCRIEQWTILIGGRAGNGYRNAPFLYPTIEAKSEGDPPFVFVQDAPGGAEQAEGNRRGKVTGSFFHVIAAEEPG
ncbi:MAG TPA: hypothetical protein VH598_04060 [Verrucomicrobiae bacterium]|nr:hypothetical protein [Verrucomicrobiae bacterium]